jgi:hypothetical protein
LREKTVFAVLQRSTWASKRSTAQIDCPLKAAYDATSEVMACDLLLEDAAEGRISAETVS